MIPTCNLASGGGRDKIAEHRLDSVPEMRVALALALHSMADLSISQAASKRVNYSPTAHCHARKGASGPTQEGLDALCVTF